MKQKVEKYLDRISYSGSLEPTSETLRALHRAHMFAVPFENLDIHINREIVLDEERILQKIIDERRGGFCYELNGAFAWLLRELGFEVEMLAAGVARADGSFGPPFDHMALLVRLLERWLADVGFGDSFVEPLLLDERGEQQQVSGAYRIVNDSEDWLIMQERAESSWRPQYRFTLRPYELGDYVEMCRYHQTSPQSSFTQKRTCSRATETGRITLTGMRLITTAKGERHERLLADEAEYDAALRKHFGIELEQSACRMLIR